MKLHILSLLIIGCLLSCNSKPSATNNEINDNLDHDVEVLYFHTRKRCATCLAIEEATKEVLDNNFAKQLKDGDITYQVIVLGTSEGEAIASKYKIAGTSLLINKYSDHGIIEHNLTNYAFSKALKSSEIFKDSLKTKINELLAE